MQGSMSDKVRRCQNANVPDVRLFGSAVTERHLKSAQHEEISQMSHEKKLRDLLLLDEAQGKASQAGQNSLR